MPSRSTAAAGSPTTRRGCWPTRAGCSGCAGAPRRRSRPVAGRWTWPGTPRTRGGSPRPRPSSPRPCSTAATRPRWRGSHPCWRRPTPWRCGSGTEAYVLRSVAPLAEATGDPQLVERADALLRTVRTPPGGAWLGGGDCYLSVARALLSLGEPERARAALGPLLVARPGARLDPVGGGRSARGRRGARRAGRCGRRPVRRGAGREPGGPARDATPRRAGGCPRRHRDLTAVTAARPGGPRPARHHPGRRGGSRPRGRSRRRSPAPARRG